MLWPRASFLHNIRNRLIEIVSHVTRLLHGLDSTRFASSGLEPSTQPTQLPYRGRLARFTSSL